MWGKPTEGPVLGTVLTLWPPWFWKFTYNRRLLALGSVHTGCVGSWFLRGVYRRCRLSSWGCTYFRGRFVHGIIITCRCGRHTFASVPTVKQSSKRPDATYTSQNRWGTTAGETSKTIIGALPRTMTTTVGPLPRYTSKHPDCNGATEPWPQHTTTVGTPPRLCIHSRESSNHHGRHTFQDGGRYTSKNRRPYSTCTSKSQAPKRILYVVTIWFV